jgi:tetratricopeptide (TPR) repeat protein
MKATSLTVRQSLHGVLGKLWRRVSGKAGEQTWLLPGGQSAEQCGERRSDLLLVWATDEGDLLDERWLTSRWPGSQRCQRLGERLFLVYGVEMPEVGTDVERAQAAGCPYQQAEQMLAEARQAGDRNKETSALADLALIYLHEGQVQRAIPLLEQALPLVRALGDRSREGDLLSDLGLAMLIAGQYPHAQALNEQALAIGREKGDRFAEKMALDRLAQTYAKLGDGARALAAFGQALTMARELRDGKHETELLWLLAIQYAEMGRTNEAIASAQATVDRLQELGNPRAALYAEHLRRFRLGEPVLGSNGSAASQAMSWTETVRIEEFAAGGWPAAGTRPAPATARGPGLLRMALSAAKSMARFVGSGGEMVASPVLHQRLRTCAACEHHTGLRCRLCGCFTNLKARMAHERCPIGKWPG